MREQKHSLLTRLVFSEFLWRLTGVFAKPREWIVARRLNFISTGDCSATLEERESRLL